MFLLTLTLTLLLQGSDMPPAISDAFRAGRLDEAAVLIDMAAEKQGAANDEVTLLRAELAVERGAMPEADKIIASVKPSEALHCRIDRVRGLAAASGDRKDTAIDLLGEVAESCKADWRVWTSLGSLLGDRGEGEASRFAFSNALREAGDRPEVRRQFARTLLKLGDPLSAARELQPYVHDNARDNETTRLLDFANGMRGLQPERSAGDTDESWAQRLTEAAQGAREGGERDLARALFAQALLVSPRYDVRLLSEASAP